MRYNGSHPGELADSSKYRSIRDAYRMINFGHPALNDFNLAGPGSRMTTANCYIVERRGTYKFPLVYGNAINDGRANPNAYTTLPKPNRLPSNMWTPYFTDGTNRRIDSPYITNAASVELIWSSDVRMNSPFAGIKDLKLESGFVKFTIQQFTFGNHLIAVKDQGGKVIWTWHIWCTTDVGLSNGFMNKLLGSLPGYGGIKEFVEQVEVNQIDAKGQSQTFPVKILKTLEAESGLYYTHGRMVPSLSTNNYYYKHNNKRITSFKPVRKNGTDLKFGYKNEANGPNPISDPLTIHQLYSINQPVLNAWNRDPEGSPVKTVYDPCPRGYRVPTPSELNNADVSRYKLGRLSRPYNQNSELHIPIAEYMERAYLLNTINYSSNPSGGNPNGFIYAPILPIRE